MGLNTCLTGSYPPIEGAFSYFEAADKETAQEKVMQGIERAVSDQLAAGIDLLVDGQVRDDILTLFLSRFPGISYDGIFYHIVSEIHPAEQPITVDDLRYAMSLAPGKRFKAHVTGPTSLARGGQIRLAAKEYQSLHDPNLVYDLARALAREAHHLKQAGAEIIQIDEPALVHGADLDVAIRALEILVEEGQLEHVWLHACGDIRQAFEILVRRAPVEVISLEGAWLDEPGFSHVDKKYLDDNQKKLCYGCIRVDKNEVENVAVLRRVLGRAVDRFGYDRIAAISPNCGFRNADYLIACRKMNAMVEAARTLDTDEEGLP